jgi:hypothetical protein
MQEEAVPAVKHQVVVSSVRFCPQTSPEPVVLNEICNFSLECNEETLHGVRCYHLPLANREFDEDFRFLYKKSADEEWQEIPDEDHEEEKCVIQGDQVYIIIY